MLNARVDGDAAKKMPRIDGYCTHWRIATLPLCDLAPGEHEIEVVLIDERPDMKAILSEKNRGDFEKHPANYEPNAWYAGTVLVFGDAEPVSGCQPIGPSESRTP